MFIPLECQYIYFADKNENSVHEVSYVLETL